MPRDSNGNTVPLPRTIVNTGDTVLPSQHNPMVNDVYAMMTQSLSRDGQGGMRANLDMHGFRILNVGPGEAATDGASVSQVQNGTPVGVVIDYAGSNAPATWMFAYGQAVSRTTYAALFAAIGTTYGNGDGTTTFNLPDLRGRVVAGKDDMGGADAGRLSFFGAVARAIGGVFGAASHVLTIGEMPRHNHTGSVNGAGEHSHVTNITGDSWSEQNSNIISVSGRNLITKNLPFNSNVAGWHQHSIPAEGGGAAHTNAQPTMIMNKIIKVSY